MKIENVKLKEHIIVYIDILGATEMISENKDENLKKIYDIYTNTIKRYKLLSKDKRNGLKVRVFSDNILISYKINSRKNNYRKIVQRVFYFISSLYWEFSKKAILIRGGITVGNLFHNRTLAWGEGLVSAYKLESKVATYPRIVIDTKLLKKIRTKKYFFDNIEPFISRDNDGIEHFNWLYEISDETAEEYIKKIKKLKNKFKKELKKYKNNKGENLDIIKKHEWNLSYIKSRIKSYKDGLKDIDENPTHIE